MSDAASILILTSCTATKAPLGRERTVLAEDLYTGQQHRRLMRGVGTYRDAGQPAGPLELYIVSAGRGVVAGNESLRHYDATFAGMGRQQLHRHGRRLGVPRAVAGLLAASWNLVVVLLGEAYLEAARITEVTSLGSQTLVFTSPRSATRLPALEGLSLITLDNSDARRFSCALVGLKGELVARLLTRLANQPTSSIPRQRRELLTWLERRSALAVRPPKHDLMAA